MKIEAIAGDGSGNSTATVWAEVEGAHVVITIDPYGTGQESAMLTPDQADHLADVIVSEAKLARIIPEG